MAEAKDPNVEAQFQKEFSDALAQASADARNLFDLREAQMRENAAQSASEAEVPAGTSGRGQYSTKQTNVHAKVPWFTGTHATYTWESFLIALEIAELNSKYSDDERKQMLLQNLDGAARMFLMANRHLLHAKYADVKAAFAKRFASKKAHSLTKLRAMSMQPGEKVLLWYARVLAVGDNIVAADTIGITDPEVLASIKGQMTTLELLLMDQFKRGLRSEIRNQMKAETFTTLESCAKAAEEAEEFLEATSVQVNHLGGELLHVEQVNHVSKTTNAAIGQVRQMNDRFPNGKGSEGRKVRVTAENVTCFRCSGKHFVRDCPEPPTPFNVQKQGVRSGSSKRTQNRSKSRERTVETNNVNAQPSIAEQLTRLTNKLDRMSFRGRRSRSHSRSRSTSRSRSASRSRKGTGRYRSSSRRSRDSSRSTSRHGHSRRVNYASKSKNQ